MEELADVILSVAGSVWIYPIVFALTLADAFLVIMPSETMVVALAALSMSAGMRRCSARLSDNPVLAVVLSVVTALTLGVPIDHVAARIADRRRPVAPPERG
ncbi:MAG: hypothetical protein ABWX59_12790 [Microbacteriaceae bacterium]